MKTNIYVKTLLIMILLLSVVFFINNEIDVYAEEAVILEPGTNAETATYFYFNPYTWSTRANYYRNFDTSTSVGHYNAGIYSTTPNAYGSVYGYLSRKMWREQYDGKYVWFTTNMPQNPIEEVRITDMSYLMENLQTSVGVNRLDFGVTSSDLTYPGDIKNVPYRYNLKKGSQNKWGEYQGWNSGKKTILVGSFYGKKFEWRFLGYTEDGGLMHNPYFPSDYYYNSNTNTSTGFQTYWSQRNWYNNPWTHSLYQRVYNSSTKPKHANATNMANHFLTEYPLFKNKNSDPSYWTTRIVPLSNPNTSATVWTGVHNNAGSDFYTIFTTEGPPQPNLRLWFFGLQKDNGDYEQTTGFNNRDFYALRVRSAEKNVTTSDATWTVTPGEELPRGVEVRMVAAYRFQDTEWRGDMKSSYGGNNSRFTIDFTGRYLDAIGSAKNIDNHPHAYKIRGLTSFQNKSSLNVGEDVWFNVPVEIGKIYGTTTNLNNVSQGEFIPSVPEAFYQNNRNNNTEDDSLVIVAPIVGNNIYPEFLGFRDSFGMDVSVIKPGEEYTAVYKYVKETKGNVNVNIDKISLGINFNDGDLIQTRIETPPTDGIVYDKYGDKTYEFDLIDAKDYTIHEAKITPLSNKLCTRAMINRDYLQGISPNPNENIDDDITPMYCIENDRNIIVSNVKAVPDTLVLPSGRTSQYRTYNVTYKLTNLNMDGETFDVPMVYTVNGTRTNPTNGMTNIRVAGNKSVTVTATFAHNVDANTDYKIRVEANPPDSNGNRKYREVLIDGSEPYADNIGHDTLSVYQSDDFCTVNHTSNTWNQTFNVTEVYWYWVSSGYWGYAGTYPNGWSYYVDTSHWRTDTYYSNSGPYSFYENLNLESVKMTTDGMGSEQNKTYELTNTTGKVRAGQNFSLEIRTKYVSNANVAVSNLYNGDSSEYWLRNVYRAYSYERYVSPSYDIAHNYNTDHRVIVKVSFDGQKYNRQTVKTSETGTKQNMTRTFKLSDNEGLGDKIFVGSDTKDGIYTIEVQSERFFGNPLKPTNRELCIKQSFQIQVGGSNNDKVNTHINNDFN